MFIEAIAWLIAIGLIALFLLMVRSDMQARKRRNNALAENAKLQQQVIDELDNLEEAMLRLKDTFNQSKTPDVSRTVRMYDTDITIGLYFFTTDENQRNQAFSSMEQMYNYYLDAAEHFVDEYIARESHGGDGKAVLLADNHILIIKLHSYLNGYVDDNGVAIRAIDFSAKAPESK